MDDPPAWKRLRVGDPHDFGIFKVRTLEVADPRNHRPYARTVIEATDWVNVVALTEDDAIILVRQFRFGTWSNSLEIPGGMVDPGEAPEAAARRELEEETGFRPASLELLGACHPNPAIFSNRLHGYLARGCVRVHQGAAEAAEDLRVELVSRDGLRRLVREGQVTHALVLATLLYEAWR